MKGKFFINGEDAFLNYGIVVGQNAYKALVQYPASKKVESNSWPEEDGIEPDLSSLELDTREFNLEFFRIHTNPIEEFLPVLYSKPYHTFHFTELDYTVTLRLVSQPDLMLRKKLDRFTLSFAHDFPMEGYEYQPPLSYGPTTSDYDFDGIGFSDYGVYLLDGSDEEIARSPAVKKNLLVNAGSRSGATYHGKKVVFDSKEVKLTCLLHAPDVKSFWQNYNALLHDISRPGEHFFYTDKLMEEFPVYYKSATVNRFEKNRSGRVWCEFSLTLVFTSFRIDEMSYLLAAESGIYIVTENENYYIDMKVYGNQEN